MRIRKNVAYLSAAEKTAFVNAVLALKQRPSILHPDNPALSRYDDYPEIHMNAMMVTPGWAHRGPAFCPWHRVMLLQFENDLIALDSSVTIPYWDWTDPASFPFTTDFLGTNGTGPNNIVVDGPFASDAPAHWTIKVKDDPGDPSFLQRNFGANTTATALPTLAQVNAALGITPYDNPPWLGTTGSFRSSLENDLHNLVHRWVGGTMGAMTSTNDPVFFLHHANIDRLWSKWQREHLGGAPYLPVAGAPEGHNLQDSMIFNDAPLAPWQGAITPAEVINTASLGYTYDDDVRLPKLHKDLEFTRVLFGVINDAPGVVIGPDGKPHPVPGGPGPMWNQLSSLQRDQLLGSAVRELAGLVHSEAARKSLQDAASHLPGR